MVEALKAKKIAPWKPMLQFIIALSGATVAGPVAMNPLSGIFADKWHPAMEDTIISMLATDKNTLSAETRKRLDAITELQERLDVLKKKKGDKKWFNFEPGISFADRFEKTREWYERVQKEGLKKWMSDDNEPALQAKILKLQTEQSAAEATAAMKDASLNRFRAVFFGAKFLLFYLASAPFMFLLTYMSIRNMQKRAPHNAVVNDLGKIIDEVHALRAESEARFDAQLVVIRSIVETLEAGQEPSEELLMRLQAEMSAAMAISGRLPEIEKHAQDIASQGGGDSAEGQE